MSTKFFASLILLDCMITVRLPMMHFPPGCCFISVNKILTSLHILGCSEQTKESDSLNWLQKTRALQTLYFNFVNITRN